MKTIATISQDKKFLVTIILVGIVLRITAATRGHNYDFESYLIVLKILERGENLYAETTRYNYGPIWSYILLVLYNFSFKNEFVFRYLLVIFLCFIDIGIFAILYYEFSRLAALLFLLSPITIIISGYHNQFDNLAILLAMCSAVLLKDSCKRPLSHKFYIGLSLLGLSLATKHIFFLYPVWLAVKQRDFSIKMIILSFPISLFVLSFTPYWDTGKSGIINNVFFYPSRETNIFYRLFVPTVIQQLFSGRIIWIIILIAGAFVFKQRDEIQSLLLYTSILVAASPAMANQYLAIPVPFLSVYPNIFTFAYSIIAAMQLAMDTDGLNFLSLRESFNYDQEIYYMIIIVLLCASILWAVWSQRYSMRRYKSDKGIKDK